MIIGITGLYCSGKDTVAEYLVEKGFAHISLSDILREQMKKMNIEITRDNLIKYGNDLRKLLGPGVLAEIAISRFARGDNYAISSIRSPAEAEVLNRFGDFVLIKVQAAASLRFKRILERKRESDP